MTQYWLLCPFHYGKRAALSKTCAFCRIDLREIAFFFSEKKFICSETSQTFTNTFLTHFSRLENVIFKYDDKYFKEYVLLKRTCEGLSLHCI